MSSPVRKLNPVVVVDDDHDDFLLFSDAYSAASCNNELQHFDDPLKFLEYLWRTRLENYPSLVILDYNMPVVHGKQILKEVRSLDKFKSIPFIILSTGGGAREKREFLDLGADAFYSKPANFNELVGLVSELMKTYCSE